MPWHDVDGSILFIKYYTVPNMVHVIAHQVERKTFSAQRSLKAVRSFLYLKEGRGRKRLFSASLSEKSESLKGREPNLFYMVWF